RRTPCSRRQLRFMPDKPVAETRHIFAAQTMVRINRHAQQPVRWDTGWLFLQTFQPLLETERRRDKHELAPVLLGQRHSLKVVNGTIRQTLQWPPDQTSLLLPIGGQVEFVKRVGDMIVAEQKARVGERDHTRGVVSVITIQLPEWDRRDHSYARRRFIGRRRDGLRTGSLVTPEGKQGVRSKHQRAPP